MCAIKLIFGTGFLGLDPPKTHIYSTKHNAAVTVCYIYSSEQGDTLTRPYNVVTMSPLKSHQCLVFDIDLIIPLLSSPLPTHLPVPASELSTNRRKAWRSHNQSEAGASLWHPTKAFSRQFGPTTKITFGKLG